MIEAALRAAGCVAAADEAAELRTAARDDTHLAELVRLRCEGEPLAWLTGKVRFCGIDVIVDRGVYVPRWQTEAVAAAAIDALPANGIALDVCCGSGAVAKVLGASRQHASVLALDIDRRAIACARKNGVEAAESDLFSAVPEAWRGRTDLVVAVPPYVPSPAVAMLGRTREPRLALDGGDDGLTLIRRIAVDAPQWLRYGGRLVTELGAPQVAAVRELLVESGFVGASVVVDGDGDVAGVTAEFGRGN